VDNTQNIITCSFDNLIKYWVLEDDDYIISHVVEHDCIVWKVDIYKDILVSVSNDLKIKI